MTQDLSLILEKSVFMVASVKHQSVATFGHSQRGWRIGGGDIDLSLCKALMLAYLFCLSPMKTPAHMAGGKCEIHCSLLPFWL